MLTHANLQMLSGIRLFFNGARSSANTEKMLCDAMHTAVLFLETTNLIFEKS